jgi:hypothetical protein
MQGITPAQSNCALTAMLQPGAAKRIQYFPRMGMALFAPNAWPRICQITQSRTVRSIRLGRPVIGLEQTLEKNDGPN